MIGAVIQNRVKGHDLADVTDDLMGRGASVGDRGALWDGTVGTGSQKSLHLFRIVHFVQLINH